MGCEIRRAVFAVVGGLIIFMAVGAYACYKLMTSFPDVSIVIHIILAGGIAAAVGAAFGLPSLRTKGFYLAVATLAA